MERSYLSWWVSGAAPAGVGALSPLPEVTLPALRHHRYRLTDEDGGWSAASPAVPAQMQLSGGAQPVWLRFPLFLFFLPTFFFFLLLLQQKGGASPPPHHPRPPHCSVFAWACCEVEGALIALERVCDYGAFRDQSLGSGPGFDALSQLSWPCS